jgi:hypothetical protein
MKMSDLLTPGITSWVSFQCQVGSFDAGYGCSMMARLVCRSLIPTVSWIWLKECMNLKIRDGKLHMDWLFFSIADNFC